jgi:hypothetical protein
MNLAPIHRHFGELLLILPVVVILVALFKGKTVLPRIVAVLLDVQMVLGAVTFAIQSKVASIPHILCMVAAIAIAHVFAKRENQAQVAVGFAGVLALLVVGYLFQKNILPDAGLRWDIR